MEREREAEMILLLFGLDHILHDISPWEEAQYCSCTYDYLTTHKLNNSNLHRIYHQFDISRLP